MALDWSEAAKAKRSASAKKAAETRKAKKAHAAEYANEQATIMAEAIAEEKHVVARRAEGMKNAVLDYPYITNSRVARWALSGVSLLAMMRGATRTRWGRHPHNIYIPQRG